MSRSVVVEGTVRSLIDVPHRPTGAASQVKAQGQCARSDFGLIRQVERITKEMEYVVSRVQYY